MSPQRMALRTILLGRPRSVLAMLLIAASLCVLDLFAGHIASVRARLEHQAVIGERLGHLSVFRSGTARDGTPQLKMFDSAEAKLVKDIVAASNGISLVMPQMSVSGIAQAGRRSTLFYGEGVGIVPERGPGDMPQLPGKLNPTQRNGIAVSSRQAQSLGVRSGSSITLTGATLDARAAPLNAEVVDVFASSATGPDARSLLMPFDMAQTLLDTQRTERFVVFLADPSQLEQQRTALLASLRGRGAEVEIRSWQEQSLAYARERSESDLAFDSVAGMVFAVIAAAIAATISMNALERRAEVGTLRAFGMSSSSVFMMFAAEALWMAMIGISISLMASGLIAWVVNRAGLSYSAPHALQGTPMLVELDFNRMLMAVVTVLAVTLLAALVPSFKAARASIAPALAS